MQLVKHNKIGRLRNIVEKSNWDGHTSVVERVCRCCRSKLWYGDEFLLRLGCGLSTVRVVVGGCQGFLGC